MAKTHKTVIQTKKWSDGGRVSPKTRNRLEQEQEQKRAMRSGRYDLLVQVDDDLDGDYEGVDAE